MHPPAPVGLPLTSGGCVIEKIDAIIAEHGVTYWPTSTGAEDGSTGTSSTSTSTSTSSSTTVQSSTEAAAPWRLDDVPVNTDTTERDAEQQHRAGGHVCGDGVVEEDEACDDGNADPDDGCKECARDSIVFISSEVYQGFKLGGLAGADQRCRSLAAKAGLLRPETFRAWLSTPTMSAADRMSHSKGRYTLVNGLVIASDWASLTSGSLQNTITVDENSQTQDSRSWTGTLADGQPAVGSEFCGDWDDDSGLILFGGAGRSLSPTTAGPSSSTPGNSNSEPLAPRLDSYWYVTRLCRCVSRPGCRCI
jgi:cysteine-rich repeat protein